MIQGQRFRDRIEAGKLLAQRLAAYAHRDDVLVLALPRGGVPVAYTVAHALGAELDLLIVRKLGMPFHEEYAIGAIGSGGVRVLQPGVPGLMGVTQEQVDAITAREQAEITRRERLYRDARPHVHMQGRTVLLVDDGIATGATMEAAIRVARKAGAARVVVAVPVAPPDTIDRLSDQADDMVCLEAPPFFRAVSQWYEHFDQTSDEEVQDLLAQAWHDQGAGRPDITTQPQERTKHGPTTDERHRT
ncbi:phosphoribosyltransferase [Massilia horti]|uniref:Phosphoribosyltransferase n=1 Tax=Massilia horti TaxID=2562153 RepID=A0A4Y9T735_9BURK|nr:phosphoribosyltransferase [Massilia horti]TFW34830.1 phosphoribosyltransferase [Massilia horti]